MPPPHQWSLKRGMEQKRWPLWFKLYVQAPFMLASFPFLGWIIPQLAGQSSQGEEELCSPSWRCVFTAHVKASQVFHWAGQPDTLPKDLHWGSRDALFSNSSPAVAVMANACCHGNRGGEKRGKQLVSDQYGSWDCKAAWVSAHKWSEDLSFLLWKRWDFCLNVGFEMKDFTFWAFWVRLAPC